LDILIIIFKYLIKLKINIINKKYIN